jgi:hypothetical protein
MLQHDPTTGPTNDGLPHGQIGHMSGALGDGGPLINIYIFSYEHWCVFTLTNVGLW